MCHRFHRLVSNFFDTAPIGRVAHLLGYRPGIRERFIFQQHRYCSNFYWKTFAANMRILWPFSFRDSYMSPGNRFQVSPLFDNCISDIKCWAMGPDLFSQYPELCSDIPAASQTPRGVSAETQLRLAHSPHRQPTAQNLTNSAKVVNAHSHEREDAQHVYSETSYFESSEHHSSLLDGDGTVFPLDTSPSFDLFYQLYENMPSTEVS